MKRLYGSHLFWEGKMTSPTIPQSFLDAHHQCRTENPMASKTKFEELCKEIKSLLDENYDPDSTNHIPAALLVYGNVLIHCALVMKAALEECSGMTRNAKALAKVNRILNGESEAAKDDRGDG